MIFQDGVRVAESAWYTPLVQAFVFVKTKKLKKWLPLSRIENKEFVPSRTGRVYKDFKKKTVKLRQ